MSHTKELIEETLDKLEKYLEEKHLSEDITIFTVRRTGLNRYFNKLGIQVVRINEWQYAQKWYTNYFGKLSSFQFLRLASNDPSAFDTTYELLADEQSKRTFDWYVRYRTAHAFIGEEAYEIFASPITKELWQEMETKVEIKSKNIVSINDFDIEASKDSIVYSFLVEQYSYDNIVRAKEDDVVFDVGAYVGDTALWFSRLVGHRGKVYAFEPEPENFKKLRLNLERNRAQNIVQLECALSDEEGEMIISGGGSSATVANDVNGIPVMVTTIDKFVKDNNLTRVDFIKMDVEGHELNVLKGAAETIKTFKPRLAISAYHRGDDLVKLPKFLLELNPNYKFYLRHCSCSWIETVLYAT